MPGYRRTCQAKFRGLVSVVQRTVTYNLHVTAGKQDKVQYTDHRLWWLRPLDRKSLRSARENWLGLPVAVAAERRRGRL
jgi:hypothetical protein